ncbi:S8 family peptidase [Chryseobacterium sp. KMC2]|uniref:S8 family peptidase n=1 Tax=Chryseobacterium sp. KMC2 TaxID=2800705 RepID=UPI00192494F7|nr:S8 family peptidase [Chryseobacterium sp. KMC2]MBL3546295.1 S8 family peptidase [Chryseobacterium sp. KMC2]
MKKIFISISTLAISLISAQKSNETLMREFEKQRTEKSKKFDAYIEKLKDNKEDPKTIDELKKQKNSLAGFMPGGAPTFYRVKDFIQSKNSNADYLQNGQITGLSSSFNGENIKYTVFDGGRVLGTHQLFNNLPNRITNKENPGVAYDFHATAVSGFIGAKPYNLTKTFLDEGGNVVANAINLNLAGIAKNSRMDSYSYEDSVLPGNTTPSSLNQKILIAQPKISNHSYGQEYGWFINQDPYNPGNRVLFWAGEKPSIGSRTLEGTYYTGDRDLDKIVYSNPSFTIVKAAGNSYGTGSVPGVPKYYEQNGLPVLFTTSDPVPQNNCAQGYDCLSDAAAKNIIVVGANDLITTNNERYTGIPDVIHSYYSSAGPRDDGGIKPDITATGTDVVSASVKNTNQEDYIYDSGTSYSAPVVTGIIGLWMQINKQLFNGAELNASSTKTLMVHSALEAGNIGPDPYFGWGLINARNGAELLVGKSNNSVIFNNETLTSGITNTRTVTASGSEPLKVTISWIDPAYTNFDDSDNASWTPLYNNRASRLVNDLDLRIIDTENNTVYMPWKLDANSPMTPATKGDNKVDNVEQVVINTPPAGRKYRIEIKNKGTLINDVGANAPQNFSIIVTGYSSVLGTKETNALNSIAIAPTVTKDIINVLKAPKKSTFTIYDLSGKKLQSGTINSDQETVDLSAYTKGIYIVEVKTDQEVITKKVIKE